MAETNAHVRPGPFPLYTPVCSMLQDIFDALNTQLEVLARATHEMAINAISGPATLGALIDRPIKTPPLVPAIAMVIIHDKAKGQLVGN